MLSYITLTTKLKPKADMYLTILYRRLESHSNWVHTLFW